ncbi:hypothetical protein N657DRAFT_565825 [Parathielavia appendiculata]|uniref:Ubiquitin-like domain-containing protein n=1 Tax=Parathielavia appendiculata TaxID=2587402 RepID=A0AAN6Z6F1_9PEZI|nr:hypothetical protein N657DRAFT_565825 [Parathielavia appendiculata]
MADDRSNSASTASQGGAPLVVNLQIVSPTVGVGNLRFPDIPATTTLQQLKEKIRNSLSWRPADDHQRLIHRGRLLARDTDTLQDVFGEEAIRANEQQTIHLVIRDTGDIPPLSNPVSNPQPHAHHHPHPALRNASMPRPGSAPHAAPHVTTHLQHHRQQQDMLQRLAQLHQREANYRQLLEEAQYRQSLVQQQNNRAAMAHQAPHEGANNSQGNVVEPAGGRNNTFGRGPLGQSHQTVTHEGTGPDGQRYSFRITMNEVVVPSSTVPRPPVGPGQTPDPVGQRPLSAAGVRNIMHGTDATRAAQAMASAMQRNASGVHPANMAAELANFNFNSPVQPIQPGVTTPIFPGLSRNASRAATPDTSARSVSQGSSVGARSLHVPSQTSANQGHPEVYILSSPTGPRGLLINSASEMYTTPVPRAMPVMPNFYRPLTPSLIPGETLRPEMQIQQGQAHIMITGQGPAPAHTQPYRPHSPLVQQQPLPQVPNNEQPPAIRRRPVAAPAAVAAPAVVQPAAQLNHPGNPGVAPLIAAVWPHVWLIVRLALFAWWFSYSDPSWERWLSLVVAFVVVFAINTGIFNGMVNNAFHPVREQLEGMIPFADPDRQHQQQNQPAAGVNQNGEAGANPDPAQAAARLLAQRRIQNGTWLRDQMRRIERAGILFLASFAPGVAERHIQQLEERERAERRAAEEARAVAAAALSQQQAEQAVAESQESRETQRDEVLDGTAAPQQPQAPEGLPQAGFGPGVGAFG